MCECDNRANGQTDRHVVYFVDYCLFVCLLLVIAPSASFICYQLALPPFLPSFAELTPSLSLHCHFGLLSFLGHRLFNKKKELEREREGSTLPHQQKHDKEVTHTPKKKRERGCTVHLTNHTSLSLFLHTIHIQLKWKSKTQIEWRNNSAIGDTDGPVH